MSIEKNYSKSLNLRKSFVDRQFVYLQATLQRAAVSRNRRHVVFMLTMRLPVFLLLLLLNRKNNIVIIKALSNACRLDMLQYKTSCFFNSSHFPPQLLSAEQSSNNIIYWCFFTTCRCGCTDCSCCYLFSCDRATRRIYEWCWLVCCCKKFWPLFAGWVERMCDTLR